MAQLDAKGLMKACQALNARISSRDWPGATREIIEIYLDEADRSKAPEEAIERACIAYWGEQTFYRTFGEKSRRGIREAMRRAASEFANDPQELADNPEVRTDDLASQLRWFSEKKKWPKGLEGMPELLAKAAAAVSAALAKPPPAHEANMQISDVMVELACKAVTDRRGFVWPDEFTDEEKTIGRENMRAALEAVLSPRLHGKDSDGYSHAVKAMDDAFGIGVSEAHDLLRENAGAKRIYDCAISALSAQVQDESEIVDCLTSGKPFVFDPATNFCHADDGGAPECGIKYVPAAQVQEVAGWHARCGELLCLISDLTESDGELFDSDDREKIDAIDADWRAGYDADDVSNPPTGWQIVPKQPTDDMLDAALAIHETRDGEDEEFRAEFKRTYRAMLAAAPAKQGG
ncbi:hypothetical protein PCC82_06530 [Agrobacterium deltaense]